MTRPRVHRDDAVPGAWCLDALLAAMLLAASAAWAGFLAKGSVAVDLTLAGAFLVAAAGFTLHGVAGWRREHPREHPRVRVHR